MPPWTVAGDNQGNDSKFQPRSPVLQGRRREGELLARGSANEIGRVAKRFSVICLRMGPQARPCPESGHVQVSFRRETKGEEV